MRRIWIVAAVVMFVGGCSLQRTAEKTSVPQEKVPSVLSDTAGYPPPPVDTTITGVADLIYRRRWDEALDSIRLASYLDSLDREFLLGYVNMKLGNFATAESIFAGLFAATDYDLGDWVNFYLAKCAYENEDYSLAHQLAKTVGKLPGYEGDIARIRWRSLWESGKKEQTIAELDTLRKIGAISRWNHDYFVGYCYARMGKTKKAKRIFRNIIDSLKGKRKYCWYVEHSCEQLGKLKNLSQSDMKLIAEGYYRCREYADALVWLKKIKNLQKDGRLHYYKAVCELKQGMYSAAISDLKRIIKLKNYPVSYAWWRLGYCYRKLGRFDEGLAAQDSAIRYAVNASVESYAWREKVLLARQKNDWELLTYSAARLVETAGGSNDAAIGLLWAGFGYHQLGKPDSAAEFLRKHFHDFKDDDFKDEILFWIGRFYYESGDTALADSLWEKLARTHRDNLFVWLAREKISGVSSPPPDSFVEIPDIPADSVYFAVRKTLMKRRGKYVASLPQDRMFLRAGHMAKLGMLDVARVVFDDMLEAGKIGRTAGEKLELWRYFYALRMYSLAAKVGSQILFALPPGDYAAKRLLYLLPHRRLVEYYARKYDINPLFVYAVMYQESFFDPYARSYADARGLMQFIPSTGRETARRAGIDDFDPDDLYDYRVSIHLGTYLLDELLTRWREPVYALSEYNAGGTPTKEWGKFCPIDDDPIYCAELFDYRQTRLYVKKILAKYRTYCVAYGLMDF
ncbi:transglycosylase SLT domain-containing protein [bacterium]|nr:transglycosylase SLT domain-containing protein [bacterium]